jgi:hypothetical protein
LPKNQSRSEKQFLLEPWRSIDNGVETFGDSLSEEEVLDGQVEEAEF